MARGGAVGVGDYLRLHDASLTAALDAWAGLTGEPARDDVLRDLANRLVRRRLFKTFDLGDDRPSAERLWPQALDVATRRFGAAATSYVHLDTARHAAYLASDDEALHVIDHPKYGAVTLSRLLEDMPLGQPTATIRLVCAPELVDDLRPLVEHALGRGRGGSRRAARFVMGSRIMRALAILVRGACGRIAFDPLGDASDTASDVAPRDVIGDAANSDLLLYFEFEASSGLLYDSSPAHHTATCTSCPTSTAGQLGANAAAFAGAQCITIPMRPIFTRQRSRSPSGSTRRAHSARRRSRVR